MHEISLPRPHRAAPIWRRAARTALAAAALLVSPALALAQACENPKVLRFSIIPTRSRLQ